jgi:uncharacterized Zn-binding protein involved in type VI secretion
MTQIIRLGDPSDHGGVMVSATANFIINGKKVCINQNLHSCPKVGHGITPVTATASFTSNGLKVVQVGDVAECGAVLISGSPNVST